MLSFSKPQAPSFALVRVYRLFFSYVCFANVISQPNTNFRLRIFEMVVVPGGMQSTFVGPTNFLFPRFQLALQGDRSLCGGSSHWKVGCSVHQGHEKASRWYSRFHWVCSEAKFICASPSWCCVGFIASGFSYDSSAWMVCFRRSFGFTNYVCNYLYFDPSDMH